MQQTSVQEIINDNIKEIKNSGGNDMCKQMKKRVKNQKGLTLIELLAVIVILGIITAIAVPAIGNIINNSKDRAILADAANMLAAAKLAIIDKACDSTTTEGTTTCDDADLNPYFDGTLTSGTDKVVFTSGVYTVTYSKLSDIKNKTKFGDYSTDQITETVLVEKMNE